MAYDTDEISQRGTRETKRKRKPTWKSRLLKGAFWVAWGILISNDAGKCQVRKSLHDTPKSLICQSVRSGFLTRS